MQGTKGQKNHIFWDFTSCEILHFFRLSIGRKRFAKQYYRQNFLSKKQICVVQIVGQNLIQLKKEYFP